MKTNSMTFGDRHYEGDYNRLLIAGDAKLSNSSVKKIYCAGDIEISKSNIGKIKFAGDLNADTASIKECKGAGDASFTGLCKVDTIVMIGELNAEYLECRVMRNGSHSKTVKVNSNKTPTWNGTFKAETFENHAALIIDGEFEFKNIIICERLSTTNEIDCENFYLFNDIQTECINSESIYIQAAGNVNIGFVTGTNVLISSKFKPDSKFNSIPKTAKYGSISKETNIVNIESIEADNINIEYTKCETVCGINVKIGDLCIIEKVEYSNSIEISEKAIVNEVVKV